MNIQEDYVSFETAKLLREKGFNVETEHEMWYVVKQFSTGCHWNSCTYKVGDITREYNDDCCIPMPTLQMAIKWLREVYNIDIIAPPQYDNVKWTYSAIIFKLSIPYTEIRLNDNKDKKEESCEAAIKYCLENLI